MINPRYIVITMITLNSLAGMAYAATGGWRMAIYWACAAGLNICVLLGDGK